MSGKYIGYTIGYTITGARTHGRTQARGLLRHWGNSTETIPRLTLFTACRPCCACVPVLTGCTQNPFGRCVCLHVFTVLQRASALHSECLKGLYASLWFCICKEAVLCLYIAVLPSIVFLFPHSFVVLKGSLMQDDSSLHLAFPSSNDAPSISSLL